MSAPTDSAIPRTPTLTIAYKGQPVPFVISVKTIPDRRRYEEPLRTVGAVQSGSLRAFEEQSS